MRSPAAQHWACRAFHSVTYDVAMKKKQPQVRKTAAKTKPEPRVWKVGDRVNKQGMLGPYEIRQAWPVHGAGEASKQGDAIASLSNLDRFVRDFWLWNRQRLDAVVQLTGKAKHRVFER
jgi:hypothetical protein